MRKSNNRTPSAEPLHRIKEARETAGISLRSMARRLRTTATKLREQEGSVDLWLSDLYRWQQELNVPLAELLVEPEESLCEPIRQRACLVRVAKTVNSLLKKADNPAAHRFASSLLDQLEQLMPELKGIGAWSECGQRRSGEEVGRAASRVVRIAELNVERLETDGPPLSE